jgi:hypothetical protein
MLKSFFNWNVIFVLLLLGSTGYLLWNLNTANKTIAFQQDIVYAKDHILSLKANRPPAGLKLMPFSENLDTVFSNEIFRSNYTLIVIFDPAGCGACQIEKTLWNEIHQEKICPVIGVTDVRNRQELGNYLQGSGIRIPVYQDTARAIGYWPESGTLPVKLLVNRKGQVLLADYGRDTEKQQQKFKKMIYRYMELL